MKNKVTAPVSIFAVKDVKKTAKLLCNLFNWKSAHGGSEFDILVDQSNCPSLLLHDFDEHEHTRFKGIKRKSKGVGQSLYVFADDLDNIYRKIKRRKLKVIEPLFLNENSRTKEFTFQLEEGYQLSVCESDKWIYYSI